MVDPLNLLLQPLLLPFTLMSSLLEPLTKNLQAGGLNLGQSPYQLGQYGLGGSHLSLGESMALQENIFVPQQKPAFVPEQEPNSNVDAKPATSPYVAVIPTPVASRNYVQLAKENKSKVAAFGGSRNQRIEFDPSVNLVVDPKKASVFGTDKHTK